MLVCVSERGREREKEREREREREVLAVDGRYARMCARACVCPCACACMCHMGLYIFFLVRVHGCIRSFLFFPKVVRVSQKIQSWVLLVL